VVATLVVAGTGTWLLWPSDTVPGIAAPAGEDNGERCVLDNGRPINKADLARVDAATVLHDSLIAILTQQTLHVRLEWMRDVPSYLAGQASDPSLVEGGYDFRTGEYAYHRDSGFSTMCVDGTEYQLSYDKVWEPSRGCGVATGGNASSSLELTGTVSDGILTAGLSREEAERYLARLNEGYPGYTDAGELSLAEHRGERYVRMPVTYRQTGPNGMKYGLHTLTYSFKVLGDKTFTTHPLLPGSAGTMVSQAEAVYYLDPKTMLPAYSETLIYNPEDDPRATDGEVMRVEYLRDGTVPQLQPTKATAATPAPLSWKPERRKPRASS
jgi:hypothetical protein